MTIITNREFQYLTHKVPRERIAEHHSLDERLLTKEIFSYLNIKDGVSANVVNAALRTIFTSIVHVEEIGDADFETALRFLIKGLALQIIEEG